MKYKLKEVEDLMERMQKINKEIAVLEIQDNGKTKKYMLTSYEKSSGQGNSTDLDFEATATFTASDGDVKIFPLKKVVEHFEKYLK